MQDLEFLQDLPILVNGIHPDQSVQGNMWFKSTNTLRFPLWKHTVLFLSK